MADGLQPLPGAGQIGVVQVDADQLSGRADALEQLNGVTAEADGTVHHDVAGLRVEDGDDLSEHHRTVFARGSAPATAGSWFHGGTYSFSCWPSEGCLLLAQGASRRQFPRLVTVPPRQTAPGPVPLSAAAAHRKSRLLTVAPTPARPPRRWPTRSERSPPPARRRGCRTSPRSAPSGAAVPRSRRSRPPGGRAGPPPAPLPPPTRGRRSPSRPAP